MFTSIGTPAVILILGVVALIAAWLLHWILIVIGVVLILLGIYLAVGGTLGFL
jgi:hypothetical protein